MITLKSCPACGSTGISAHPQVGLAPFVAHEIMPGVKIVTAVISHYFVCQSCRLIFQNPRMSEGELNKYYSQGYYRKQLNMTNKQISDDEAQRAKVDAQIIKMNIGEVSSHLDIGGSRGYLLGEISAKDKVIVEPNAKYPKAKGLKVYSELNTVPAQKFDLVTAIHVLEHVSKPLDYLKSMTKFVSKDGHLVIEVPTWDSPGGPLRLAHLSHLEPDVLRLMCKEAGLRVEYTEFTPHLILICKRAN